MSAILPDYSLSIITRAVKREKGTEIGKIDSDDGMVLSDKI